MNYTDKSFDPQKAADYKLFMQLDNAGFTYLVLDTKSNSFILIKKHNLSNKPEINDKLDELAEILIKTDLLNLTFKSACLIYYGKEVTLVPSSYYDKDNIYDYLQFIYKGEVSGHISSGYIKPFDSWCIFSLPDALVSMMDHQFDNISIVNQLMPFLWGLSTLNTDANQIIYGASVNDKFIDIAVFENKKLKLCNSFLYENDTDILYYILYLIKKLKTDPQKIKFYISGEKSTRISLFDNIKSQIYNTSYNNVSEGFVLAPALMPVFQHKIYNLINLHYCV